MQHAYLGLKPVDRDSRSECSWREAFVGAEHGADQPCSESGQVVHMSVESNTSIPSEQQLHNNTARRLKITPDHVRRRFCAFRAEICVYPLEHAEAQQGGPLARGNPGAILLGITKHLHEVWICITL